MRTVLNDVVFVFAKLTMTCSKKNPTRAVWLWTNTRRWIWHRHSYGKKIVRMYARTGKRTHTECQMHCSNKWLLSMFRVCAIVMTNDDCAYVSTHTCVVCMLSRIETHILDIFLNKQRHTANMRQLINERLAIVSLIAGLWLHDIAGNSMLIYAVWANTKNIEPTHTLTFGFVLFAEFATRRHIGLAWFDRA